MTKLIRPLTLQGSCLSFSNQAHGLGSRLLQKWGHNANTCFSDVWGGLGVHKGCLEISELTKGLQNAP